MADYVLDTNVVIDGRIRWYRPASFATLWQNVEQLVVNGRALCPREVQTELERGDAACLAWVKSMNGLVQESDTNVLTRAAAITAQFPLWVTPTANYADPFVIAHAQARGWTVVTAERRAGPTVAEPNLRIPNVCDHFGVACINLPDLIEAEGWTF